MRETASWPGQVINVRYLYPYEQVAEPMVTDELKLKDRAEDRIIRWCIRYSYINGKGIANALLHASGFIAILNKKKLETILFNTYI